MDALSACKKGSLGLIEAVHHCSWDMSHWIALDRKSVIKCKQQQIYDHRVPEKVGKHKKYTTYTAVSKQYPLLNVTMR